jgi:solute carrier family 45, member 1/2/4
MVFGAVGISLSIVTLAFASALSRWLFIALGVHSLEAEEELARVFGVVSMFALSISIQPLQSGLRAIVLDQCPAHQQVRAQGWAARISGIGTDHSWSSGRTLPYH